MAFAAVGVMVARSNRVCSASDSAPPLVNATLYGGLGPTALTNNEGQPAKYDERHAGLGALALVRPWGTPAWAAEDDVGGFLQLGLVGEWRALRLSACGYSCAGDTRPGFIPEADFGVRLGIGYDFRGVGVRGGELYADSPQARIARTLVLPDVAFRFGARQRGWFELGMGAYDASTALRPGLYIGGGLAIAEQLTLSAHYGWHIPAGNLGETVTQLGPRLDFGADYVLRPNLRIGAGGAYQAYRFGRGSVLTNGGLEARGQATFAF